MYEPAVSIRTFVCEKRLVEFIMAAPIKTLPVSEYIVYIKYIYVLYTAAFAGLVKRLRRHYHLCTFHLDNYFLFKHSKV